MAREQILAVLATDRVPLTGQSWVAADAVEGIEFDHGRAQITLSLGYPARSQHAAMGEHLRAQIKAQTGIEARIQFNTRIASHAVQKNLKPLAQIKNIIAVASGKGGVGKSTVAANLALALRLEGARVGMLDADIYGPSQPRMLGSSERPTSPDGKRMNPIIAHGIQTMSIGFLVDDDQPMIWRGPMVVQALNQLLLETQWQDLDYLIVDLPPGTGDIQLSLSQRIPVSGAIIVTTPQDIALLDARKGLQMFRRVEVPVLGVVENMAWHVCGNCGHQEAIFGSGGGERLSSQYGTELLGQLPLDLRIREQADSGNPTVAADPDGELAARYRQIARNATAQLAYHSAAQAFPEIQISDD